MRFMGRLSDEQLAEVLTESNQRELRSALDALPVALREQAERPEWFWQRQQAEIGGRLASAERAWTWPLTTWTSAVALFLLALVLLRGGPVPPPMQVQSDPDRDLMIAVDRAMRMDVPESLAPASLLAEEITASQGNAAQNRTSQENAHEGQN